MDDEEIAKLSEEEVQKIERVNQSFKDRYDAEADLESQKKWRTVFERAPKETIPFIIYIVYDVGMAMSVLFLLLQYSDVRLYFGGFILLVITIAPLFVLPHESWKNFFSWLKGN